MVSHLKWGILGTGNIARQFATGVLSSQRGQLRAVGSRGSNTANSFAQTYSAPAAYGSYEQLIADPAIDAVYISLPNTLHHEWTIRALRAGKHVLCEKPLAANRAEAAEMFDIARTSGRILVEAFMYRAHPLTHAVVEAARSGAIGQIKLIRTSFCYRTTRIADNIRFKPDLAGGALMDIGCYCINFSRLIAGEEPQLIHATGQLHASGVDEMAVGTMRFPSGILASFTCGMEVQADNSAWICGTDGFIQVPIPWKPPAQGAVFTISHGTPPKMDAQAGKPVAPAPPPHETITVSAGRDLYGIEADAFAAIVLDGAAPFVTEPDSLGNMAVLDEMRRQVGIRIV